jgi:hypothetical protein
VAWRERADTRHGRDGNAAHSVSRCLLIVCLLLGLTALLPPPAPTTAAPLGGLRVEGAQLIAADGQPVRLMGINRAGTEYACIQGWGFFDGPSDAASVAAIRSWGINAVRVPLNEHCWLGLDTVREGLGGAPYQAAIREWIAALREAGMYVILDLHWAAPKGLPADQLRPMPDRDHAPEFWRQVATAYGDDGAILFDLYNEPYPDFNRDTDEAWRCWRDGGTCRGFDYTAAGMQELVDAVRGTGARNVILLGGVQYANGFSRFRAYAPRDPVNSLAASWHSYNFMHWANETTWDAQIGIPTAGVPLVAGEIGQDDCKTAFLERTLRWLDARGASYLGWAWNTWNRCDGPVLIDDYDGTPSAMGWGIYDHLQRNGPAPLAPRPGEVARKSSRSDPSAPVAAPEAGGALTLYDDVVPAPFWVRPVGANATEPCDARTRVSGRCAYALSLSSWGNLSIGRDGGFSTEGYGRLEWAFNTNWQSLNSFSFALTAAGSGEPINTITLDRATIVADLGDGWVRLSLPVADLNPDGVLIGALVLRNASGRDLGTIHLDDLRFVPDDSNLGAALAAGASATATERPRAGR